MHSQGISIIEADCEKILRTVDVRCLKNKRVLITGANGFLGQYIFAAVHFANQTQKLNCKITCVSLHGPGGLVASYLPNKNIQFQKIDLSRPFHINGKFDYIFHAAGYGQPAKFTKDPRATIAINVDATQTLLELAERSKGTFIFFSSAETYGEMPAGMAAFRETYRGGPAPVGPRAVYGAAKRLGESLTLSFGKDHNVRVKVVRISHVYGPGAPASDARVLSDFIRKATNEKVIRLLDEGRAVKTYGYIVDVTAMILHVALKGKEDIYNVGGRDTLSIRELAERVGKYCGADVEIPRVASHAHFVGRDPGFVKLDLSKVKKEMKKFSFTPFALGLKNTIAWTGATTQK